MDQDQRGEGLAQIQQGWAALQAMEAELQGSYFRALLAEAFGKVGQPGEGLRVLTEALTGVEQTGERYWEAELYRIKGELTLHKSRVGSAHHAETVTEAGTVGHAHPTAEDEAEACFLKAIAIARKQQAKSLELRAVMSLAQLWQSYGKGREAHQMLSEIYNWFTEGFDTKDLQEAKALLGELYD
jgi:predicted ATPase